MTTYFMDNQTRKIPTVVKHQENSNTSFYKADWNDRVVCWLDEQKGKEGICQIGKSQVFEKKDMCLHLLMNSYDNFDDDLLNDALLISDVVK